MQHLEKKTKSPVDNLAFIENIDELDQLFEKQEKLRRQLRQHLKVWRAMLQLGIDFRFHKPQFERRNIVRVETVTHLIFKERVAYRKWSVIKYSEKGTYLMDGNEPAVGVLEEDMDQWYRDQQIDPATVFCPIKVPLREDRFRITHLIFNERVDLPKYEVTLPVPFHLPRNYADV